MEDDDSNTIEFPNVPDNLPDINETIPLLPIPEYYRTRFSNSLNPTEMAIRASLRDKQKYKYVLSEEGETELIKKKYTRDFSCNNVCPITQEEFDENEDIIGLPCNHFFKSESIREWLENNKAICPVCRYKIKSKEERVDDSSDEETPDNVIQNNANQLIRFLTRRRLLYQMLNNNQPALNNRIQLQTNTENDISENIDNSSNPTMNLHNSEVNSFLNFFVSSTISQVNNDIQNIYDEDDNMDLQNAILASMHENSEIENTRQLHTTSIFNELDSSNTDSDVE